MNTEDEKVNFVLVDIKKQIQKLTHQNEKIKSMLEEAV